MTIEYKDSKRIVGLSTDKLPSSTYETDFSSTTGWSVESGGITYVDSIHFNHPSGVAMNTGVLYDLTTSNVSETSWTLDYDLNITTSTGGSGSSCQLFIGLSNNSTVSSSAIDTAQDYLGHFMIEAAGTHAIRKGNGSDSPEDPVGTVFSRPLEADVLYCRLQRISAIKGTLSLYSDQGRTSLIESKDITITTSLESLRYLKVILACKTTSGTHVMVGDITNMKFWNTITSGIESKPTDVQDNSIMVEKDTARRYWFDDEFSKSNCKAYFTLDEASGNPANHATSANGFSDGNGINGTNGSTGATQNVTGKFDKCFDFTGGNNEQVDMGNTILSGTTDFTMACWINSEVTTSGAYMLFNSYASGYTGGVQFYINGADRKLYYWSSSGDFAGSTAISGTDGAWDFAVVTRSGTTMTIYLNGSVDGTSTVSHSIAGTNMTLGGSSGASGYVFNGKIDEASIWTRALSASEISELYNSGTGKTLLEAKTATWTMQPTLESDFSSSTGWSQQGTEIAINTGTGKLDWIGLRSSTNTGISYDFGAGVVSTSKWRLQFDLYIQNFSGTSYTQRFGWMLSTKGSADNSDQLRDFIGGRVSYRGQAPTSYQQFNTIDDQGSTDTWADNVPYQPDNGTDNGVTPVAGTTYNIVLTRDSATAYTMTISSGGTLLDTLNYTSYAGTSDLRYLLIQRYGDSASAGSSFNGTIDNLKFYNGVTTVN